MTANRLADVSTQQICRNHIIPRKPPRSTLRGSRIPQHSHAADWQAPCAVFHSCHHRECRRQCLQHRRQYIHRKGSGPHGNRRTCHYTAADESCDGFLHAYCRRRRYNFLHFSRAKECGKSYGCRQQRDDVLPDPFDCVRRSDLIFS